jgi:hypothetical protein
MSLSVFKLRIVMIIAMLTEALLSVVYSTITQNVIMLSVVMLNVVAPCKSLSLCLTKSFLRFAVLQKIINSVSVL